MFHHANEKISAVRLRAAKFAKSSPDAVELKIADEILAPNNDNKLINLSQVGETYCVSLRELQFSLVRVIALRCYLEILYKLNKNGNRIISCVK